MPENRPGSLSRLLIGAADTTIIHEFQNWLVYCKRELCGKITVILEKNVERLISKHNVSMITGNKTYSDFFEDVLEHPAPHISLPNAADAFLIFPAGPGVIAKAANGLADDLLTSCILAATCPVLFVPVVPGSVESKANYLRNVDRLRQDGYFVYENIYDRASNQFFPEIVDWVHQVVR